MTSAACPACGDVNFDELEFVDVAAQHKIYAPDDEAAQNALNEAAAETALSYTSTAKAIKRRSPIRR
jgi:hypothetical protein